MKTWTNPMAVAQQFAANDYVSACTAMINCNVPVEEGFDSLIHEYGKTVEVAFGVGERTYGYYTPCEEPYHSVSAQGELVETVMTEGILAGSSKRAKLDEPITCFTWFVHNDEGLVTDVHATLTRDGFEANKS